MAERGFFGRRSGRPGLALFLNAGDPPLEHLADVVRALDEQRVDCLELAVPFPDSVTDGPVIRESADRALATGVDLDAVLGFIRGVRHELRHLRIALLVDWSHSVRPQPLPDFLARVADSAADGLLVHGLPPRLRPSLVDGAAARGLPLVTTCYATSSPEVRAEAARHGTAYVYLVARYGRTGVRASGGFDHLAPVLGELKTQAAAPVAVGFGVRDRADLLALGEIGADAAVIGSATVERVEQALVENLDPAEELARFARSLRPVTTGQLTQQGGTR
ncbi:tryptophan synthase subunit alpha [Actinocrispum sp. NPDC049592]|uniref:tryptophan synthase subunit alpha n=1 Tax=Actinocrispum sp. NPDC049592 TaxID=3154835 RepID=UPI00343CDB44